ncbi:hypothetical protein [Candidatus Parabeggiatoa sp. HSG14]|uniref:hypothetical protein n=1 Tax=Candidatus Parabeggiatoa sp. HSG14 TaxID=3055593 RepID=UPI0025A72C9F|nr:hypothetical protein [Thiotrichales bacterium HSG14]
MSKPSIFSENFFVNLAILSLLFLSMLYFGAPTESTNLDGSWTQAFAYAFKNNFQAGVDYIFTYGPLGYFYHPISRYDADLFYLFITWQVIFNLLLATFFLIVSHRIDGKIDKFIYFFLLIVVLSAFPPESIYLLGITAAVILVITTLSNINKKLGQITLFLTILLFLAAVSLTKFVYFVLAGVGLFAMTVMVWHLYSLRLALTIPIIFTIFIMAMWLISGQSLSNFPSFIIYSLKISGGYSEAMSYDIRLVDIQYAVASFFVITLMAMVACLTKPWKLERFVIAAMVMLSLFLAWKSGFVRQGLHERIFFAFAVIVPFFLEYNRSMNAMLLVSYRALRYLAVFIALSGLFVVVNPIGYKPSNFMGHWNQRITSNFHTLLNLSQFKATQDKTVTILKQQHNLPNIRAQVGQATVDIFSWEQGMIFLNELNWHPRPVFQSYVAYTPALAAINGDFFASDKAAEFVIFKMQAVDLQFPLMNDAEAVKILLRDYQPVLKEKGYLLLKHAPRGKGIVSNGATLLSQKIKIGEQLDVRALNHKQFVLSLDIRKSLLGRLYSLLYRFPEIRLEIEDTSGIPMSYRIIPGMVTSGFVINPLIRHRGELSAWYTENIPLKKVTTLRVVVEPDWLHYLFQNDIAVKINEFNVTPYPIDDVVKQRI